VYLDFGRYLKNIYIYFVGGEVSYLFKVGTFYFLKIIHTKQKITFFLHFKGKEIGK
jgi:hypothetical protein